MKNYFFYTLFALLLIACSSDDDGRRGNPFIPNISFDTGNLINTNLPQYSQLNFPGNYIVVNNYGVNGFVLYSSGTTYIAFELTDPNQQISECSRLTVEGITATSNCDNGNSYNIVTGAPLAGTNGQFSLVPYGVEVSGNIIRVFNN